MKMAIEERGERKIYYLSFSVLKNNLVDGHRKVGQVAHVVDGYMERHNEEV